MSSPSRLAAAFLRPAARSLAAAVVERMALREPQLLAAMPGSFAAPLDDTAVRVRMLAEALDVERDALFAHQVAWYKVALLHRQVPLDYLLHNLDVLGEVLREQLRDDIAAPALAQLAVARQRALDAPGELPSHLEGHGPLRDDARRFLLAVLENRRDDAFAIVSAARQAGASVDDVENHLLSTVQREVGRMWLMAEIPIADEHFASRVVERCLDRLASGAERAPATGRAVLAFTVGGDLHGLGVRLVADRFERRGFRVWHLGADMPAADLEWFFADRAVDLIAIGATQLLNLGAARATIALLRELLGAGCPPLLVGGGPFQVVDDLHRVIGADAVANSASEAVAAAARLCGL
ncbi:MAG: cobalamin B12-binding domain-containing protein [Planctomycetes bacterium]|nr:cobalamin B12-binding domain-containing protein [Planctomycetota bacterium]